MGVLENRPAALDERCLPAFDVLRNRYGQNPCEVARRLVDVCIDLEQEAYSIPELDLVHAEQHYRPPNPRQATSCLCSMASYNLLQGCAACQQPTPYNATLWTDWVANCTMSNINGGATFPFDIPADTALPDWACVNSASGSLSVGQVFRHATGGSMSWPSNVSSSPFSTSSTATTSSSTTADDYSEAAASQTLSKISNSGDDSDPSSSGSVTKIVGIVVPLVVAGALLGAVMAYLRKKRRFKRRGHRLESNPDLPDQAVERIGSEPSTLVVGSGASMKEKGSRQSLFVPSESVFTRGSRRSFATNSVSTGDNPFHHRSSTLYTPSTGFDTVSQSTGYTFDGRSMLDYDPDDESISPFSDLHRPAPSRVTTRSNIHSPAFRRSMSTFSGSIHLSESEHSHDARSLLTTSSRAAPSSSGATYGGVYEDEDDDDDETDGEGERR